MNLHISPEMERLRGAEFEYLFYEEIEFGDHAHCENCQRKIMDAESDKEVVFRQGYAKAFETFDYPNQFGATLRWLCEDCFQAYRVELNLRPTRWLSDKLRSKGLHFKGNLNKLAPHPNEIDSE